MVYFKVAYLQVNSKYFALHRQPSQATTSSFASEVIVKEKKRVHMENKI